MLARLPLVLQNYCRLDIKNPILLGVSGGPDSVCLLDLLSRLGYRIVVAHFNHRLRAEAHEEARRVGDLADRMGVPFVVGSQDVAQYAQIKGLSIEEAAREARYKFLFEQAERLHVQAVMVGHTADDQVETVLMHLLRGAGLDGLQGMAYRSLPNPWSENIPLVRPLLAFWRQEILDYLDEHELQATIDVSNLDTTFFRNRLRLETIPYLEKVQPQLRQLLWRSADIIHHENLLLDALVGNAWIACVTEQGKGYLGLRLAALREQPTAMQRRLLRRAINKLRPGLRDVSFDTIERGLAFIASSQYQGRCSLVGELVLYKEGEIVWLSSWEAELPDVSWPKMPGAQPMELHIPGEVTLSQGWTLRAVQIMATDQIREAIDSNADPFQAWFDADELPERLQVRSRRPGDRFKPRGMQGHSLKISDLMINLKVPQRARQGWPLVCAGEEIIWVPGCRQDQRGQVGPETRRILHLTLE